MKPKWNLSFSAYFILKENPTEPVKSIILDIFFIFKTPIEYQLPVSLRLPLIYLSKLNHAAHILLFAQFPSSDDAPRKQATRGKERRPSVTIYHHLPQNRGRNCNFHLDNTHRVRAAAGGREGE